MTKPIIPYLEVGGSAEFPRFLIKEEGGRVWNGTEWADEGGELFASGETAARLCQDLQRAGHKAAFSSAFTIPLRIEVLSDGPVKPDDLVEWLRKAVDLRLNYVRNGTGPDGSLVIANIDLCGIEAGQVTELKGHDHAPGGHG